MFSWTLPHVTRPWLGRYLERVLPPSLLLSDDYREENKILGVRCLHHIILNVVRDLRNWIPSCAVFEGSNLLGFPTCKPGSAVNLAILLHLPPCPCVCSSSSC